MCSLRLREAWHPSDTYIEIARQLRRGSTVEELERPDLRRRSLVHVWRSPKQDSHCRIILGLLLYDWFRIALALSSGIETTFADRLTFVAFYSSISRSVSHYHMTGCRRLDLLASNTPCSNFGSTGAGPSTCHITVRVTVTLTWRCT